MEIAEKIKEWEVGWLRRSTLRALLVAGYVMTRVEPIRERLPKKLRKSLPVAWNNKMWWTAIRSGGDKMYGDYHSQLKVPASFKPLVEVEEPFRLTEKEIESFYTNGFIGPFDVLSREEATALADRVKEMTEKLDSKVYPYEEGYFSLPPYTQASGSELSNQDVARIAMNTRDRHLDDPQVMSVFRHPAFTERVAQLLGPDLMIWRSQFFGKRPGQIGTAWHQATTYVYESLKEHLIQPPDIDALFDLSCFVALTDATLDNGCLIFLPGTQRDIYPINVEIFKPGAKSGNDQVKRFGSRKIEIDYPIRESDIVPVEAKAGQLIIFTERVLHGSYGNKTKDQRRLALTGRVTRPDTRTYTDRMLREGHELKLISVNDIKLDRWQGLMIRGEDQYGYNRSIPVNEMPPLIQQELSVAR